MWSLQWKSQRYWCKENCQIYKNKEREIMSIDNFYFKRTKYKYLTAIILSFEIMDWDIWERFPKESQQYIDCLCIRHKPVDKEAWTWLCLVNCRIVYLLGSAVYAAIWHVELCEMLMAATCENWHEICTQGTVISAVVSVRTTLHLDLSLNKQSQLANNLKICKTI